MFANLRQGSQLHILHNTATPYIEIGIIENVSNLPMIGYYPNMPQLPIDVSVKIGDKVTTYQQLPANAESAEGTERNTGDKVIIACSKDAMSAEIQQQKQKAIDAINSVQYHQQRIKAFDALIGQLHPEVVEKQHQAQEISDLKSQLAEMRKLMEQLKDERTSSKTKKGESL